MIAELAIAAVALVGFGFAATAVALGVHVGTLRASGAEKQAELERSEREHNETRIEFANYEERTTAQIKEYQSDAQTYRDLVESCADPGVIDDYLDLLLRKAAGIGTGDESPDRLP